jgi:hypothetical protein
MPNGGTLTIESIELDGNVMFSFRATRSWSSWSEWSISTLSVKKASEESLDGLGDPGDNRIESGHFLEVFGNRMIVESRVGPYANLSNAGRQHRNALFQNLDCWMVPQTGDAKAAGAWPKSEYQNFSNPIDPR